MAWGDVNPSGGAGNYVAIGTFKEGIEIWNLDVLDPLEPITTLGGEDMSSAEAAAADAMLKAYNEKKESSKKKKVRSEKRRFDDTWLFILTRRSAPRRERRPLLLRLPRLPPPRSTPALTLTR